MLRQLKEALTPRHQSQLHLLKNMAIIIDQVLKSLIFSCNSAQNTQDQGEKSEVYEPPTDEAVIHDYNCRELIGCEVCTPRKIVKELEKKRELWWKQHKIKRFATSSSSSSSAPSPQWDPKYAEDWD